MGAEEIRYAAPPQSRNESILAATIDGAEYTDPPQSRVEDLLLQLKAKVEQGGYTVASYAAYVRPLIVFG